MIKFKSQGRLGNVLLQNVGASILAKKFNFKVKEYYRTEETNRLGITLYDGNVINEECKRYGDSTLLDLINSHEHLDHGIDYDGFFQVLDFLVQNRQEIKSSIHQTENTTQHPNDVFIHVRLGDSVGYNPGLEYYEKCLDSILNKRDVYISSDSPEHPIISILGSKYRCRLVNAAPADTMNFARRFNNLILSNGTFSWWLAMLGNPNNVFYPKRPNEFLCGFHPDIYYSDWKGIA